MKAKERKTTSRFRYPTSLRSRVSEYSVFLGLSTYLPQLAKVENKL